MSSLFRGMDSPTNGYGLIVINGYSERDQHFSFGFFDFLVFFFLYIDLGIGGKPGSFSAPFLISHHEPTLWGSKTIYVPGRAEGTGRLNLEPASATARHRRTWSSFRWRPPPDSSTPPRSGDPHRHRSTPDTKTKRRRSNSKRWRCIG